MIKAIYASGVSKRKLEKKPVYFVNRPVYLTKTLGYGGKKPVYL